MNLELRGKTALVTGGSSGIGFAVCKAFIQEGASVILMARRQEKVQSAVSELLATGGNATGICCDIGNSDSIKSAIKTLTEKNRDIKIDMLVNCAAVVAKDLPSTDPVELFRMVVGTDLNGTYELCRAVLPYIAPGGSIVNFSSVAAFCGGLSQDNYAAAKAGVCAVTRSLAAELAPENIRVNTVVPGFVDTPMTRGVHAANRENIVKAIPIGRAGRPEEIADLVLFLSSARASFITGQTIHINGGQYYG